jgi:hypothetical protein
MKTVIELPPSYKKTCTIAINDRDEDIVLRNAVILLLTFHFPNGEASELIVHLWHSAAIPSRMYQHAVIEKILPDIEEICELLASEPGNSMCGRL